MPRKRKNNTEKSMQDTQQQLQEQEIQQPLVPQDVGIRTTMDDQTIAFIDWVNGKDDLLPPDLDKQISFKNERMRLALNYMSSKTVCAMAETQDFINCCSKYLFRPERLNNMTDQEIATAMMAAIAVFDKESAFALKVAEANKDLTKSPDSRTKLMDMIVNLPKDVLEALLEQVKAKL